MGGKKAKTAVSIVGGKLAMCAPVTKYKTLKTIRKKAKGKVQITKRYIWGGEAYAKYLSDLAPAVRKILKLKKADTISGLQDNLPLHKSAPVQAACTRFNIKMIENFPPRSPDLNPIENAFGLAERLVRKEALTNKIKGRGSLAKSVARFAACLKKLEADGTLLKLALSMPRRIAAVLAAGGGPTKY